MSIIHGIRVTLIERTQSGVDGFNRPVYTDGTPVVVENVLVAPVTSDEVTTSGETGIDLDGKREIYQMAIPKGDTHNWENAKVEFFGKSWETVGHPVEGIEANIPLDWHKKVQVERYE